MSTLIGIGVSSSDDVQRAAREATQLAKFQINQERFDLVIVFSSVRVGQEKIIAGINQVVPGVKIFGCSTASVIVHSGIEKNAVAVMAIKSDRIHFGLSCLPEIDTKDARSAGQELAKAALADLGYFHRNIFTMFSDGLMGNATEVIAGVQDVLGKSFLFIGGAASDDLRFVKTYQYFNEECFTNSAIGLLWGGDIHYGFGIQHGWKPIGKTRTVTLSEANVIKRIDDAPAVTLYQDYFGPETKSLYSSRLARTAALYPLGIFLEEEQEHILRCVTTVNEDGSLICQGDVPQGSLVRLMIGSKDACIQAAREAAQEAKEMLRGKQPKFIMVIDSVARNKVLQANSFAEIEVIQAVFDKSVPLLGFYSYGEGAPLKTRGYQGQAYFHNGVIAVLAIAE
ncbi:FIST signal transduction protein [Candidatus Omnitrophota bacterium]